jgi:hypothetical protein
MVTRKLVAEAVGTFFVDEMPVVAEGPSIPTAPAPS